MPKNIRNTSKVIDDNPNASASSGGGIYAFLAKPAISSVAANTGTVTREYDEVDGLLSGVYNIYPVGYPAEHKNSDNAIRIHYLRVNVDQAQTSFRNIARTYREHALWKHADVLTKYPYLKDYLRQNPLGQEGYPYNDSRIYKNATKLTKLVSDPNAAQSASATSAAGTAPTDKSSTKTKKSKAKPKGDASKAKSTVEEASAAEDASTSVLASSTAKKPARTVVKTDFAEQLEKIQTDVYLWLRASINKYVDETTNNIVEHAIRRFETLHELHGVDRHDVTKRYTWEQIKQTTYDECCLPTSGAFYFLPLFTTMREKNTLINKWCDTIDSITKAMKAYSDEWYSLSERDAVTRLTIFFSKLEREVLEKDLTNNHAKTWKSSGKSLESYFRRARLASVIKLVKGVEISKFPSSFDPHKHAPNGVMKTLFAYAALAAKSARCEAAVKAANARATLAEEKLSKALKNNGRATRTDQKRARQDTRVETRKETGTNPSLKNETAETKRLMKVNGTGNLPCLKCARKGLRLWHKVCDPKILEANVTKRKARLARADVGKNEHNQVVRPFPPVGDDRVHPLSSYKKDDCPHCKREDCDPVYACHPPEMCFRAPGGECDKANATTRRARAAIVRKLARQRKRAKTTQRSERAPQKSENHAGFGKRTRWSS